MKIPKKLTAAIISALTAAGPLVLDSISEKRKEEAEFKKQEKIYEDQKHNGMVRNASIVFSLISLILLIIAIKQEQYIISIIGLLAVITYAITFLYCLDIIKERKHNIYKIVFIIGDMLMVATITLLFF